jgi:hypothetical protein
MDFTHKHRIGENFSRIFVSVNKNNIKIKRLTFVASTSVAICDESPQLQSNGPTVTTEKYIGAYIFCAYLIVSRIMKLILNKINSSGEIHFGKKTKINKDD